jgi:hypothetical protein
VNPKGRPKDESAPKRVSAEVNPLSSAAGLWRLGTAGAWLLAGLLVTGCATPGPQRVDPTLFPRVRTNDAVQVTAPVVVLSEPELVAYSKMYRAPDDWRSVHLPTGEIIEAAAVAAIADVLGQPVERQAGGPTTIAPERAGIQPVLVAFHPVREEVPIPRDRSGRVRLVLECRVLDADRSPLWSKLYDSGAVGLSKEQANDSSATLEIQRTRAVHRAAYAVMVEVAEDLRRWLEAERLRERVL